MHSNSTVNAGVRGTNQQVTLNHEKTNAKKLTEKVAQSLTSQRSGAGMCAELTEITKLVPPWHLHFSHLYKLQFRNEK